MPDYQVNLARSARKELENLPPSVADRILVKLEQLALQPRPSGVTKLRGDSNLWRVRAGDYRVVYAIDDVRRIVDVSHVRHRRDVYRDL